MSILEKYKSERDAQYRKTGAQDQLMLSRAEVEWLYEVMTKMDARISQFELSARR